MNKEFDDCLNAFKEGALKHPKEYACHLCEFKTIHPYAHYEVEYKKNNIQGIDHNGATPQIVELYEIAHRNFIGYLCEQCKDKKNKEKL